MLDKKIVKLLPLIIACTLTFFSFLIAFISSDTKTQYIPIDEVQRAAWGLAPIVVLAIFRKGIWKFLFAALLLISMTMYLRFFHSTIFIGNRIFDTQVDLVSSILLLAHVVINNDMITTAKEYFRKSDSEEMQDFLSKTDFFEKKLEKKSLQELGKIIDDNELVFEALLAAESLIRKRLGTKSTTELEKIIQQKQLPASLIKIAEITWHIKNLKDKSTAELETIASDNKLSGSANEAAIFLLNERAE